LAARAKADEAFASDKTRARAVKLASASARDAVAARDAARFLVDAASDAERRAAADAASRASERLAKAKALAAADEIAAHPHGGLGGGGRVLRTGRRRGGRGARQG
jgi:membrane protein involved in colicin uptake